MELGESKCGAVFGHAIVIERSRRWSRFWWVLGQIGGVLGCNTHKAFSVPRLTVGVSNEVQMVRNLTGGLPVVNQGCLASLGPIRKSLIPTHERKLEMATGGERSAECKTDYGENARMHEMNTYANTMHMMT